MTSNPKADTWFREILREFQVPWGYQAPGGKNTESLESSLVSTNRSATETAVRMRNLPLPFYQVVRYLGVDYAARPGVFRLIASPDDYHFLMACGWINIPHGAAVSIELNLLQFIRAECSRGGVAGGSIDAIANAPSVLGETMAETRAACPLCQAEGATIAGAAESE